MIAQPQYTQTVAITSQGEELVMSPEAYLDWESQQDGKYEYENGKIIAMTGGTIPHSQIPLNLGALLLAHFRGKGCKVSVSDAKVSIKNGKYYYPDVVVSCDERDRFARNFWQYPTLIAEVLSPSTEARDRGVKQQNYMTIETLQTYILIDSEGPRVEVYQRRDRVWEYQSIGIVETSFEIEDPLICLTGIDLTFALSVLYENVDFVDDAGMV
jgi:Uma2 family endonuclease